MVSHLHSSSQYGEDNTICRLHLSGSELWTHGLIKKLPGYVLNGWPLYSEWRQIYWSHKTPSCVEVKHSLSSSRTYIWWCYHHRCNDKDMKKNLIMKTWDLISLIFLDTQISDCTKCVHSMMFYIKLSSMKCVLLHYPHIFSHSYWLSIVFVIIAI